jgi:predicted RNA-binding Zn-ribbon protein involved in translation (DUF1610 family)
MPEQTVEKTCVACGAKVKRKPKPEAKTAMEKRQIDFHCPACGARNLRDGTAIPQENPRKAQGQPRRSPGVTQEKPRKTQEPERSMPSETPEEDDSFTII